MRIKLCYPLPLNRIAAVLNSSFSGDAIIENISTDTRTLESGDLFFAIRGEKYNGEDFFEIAKQKGAYTVGVNRGDILVKSTSEALLLLAEYYKTLFQNVKHTVAITGSVGKTTTKEMASALASIKYKVHATEKNYNNILGVCYTVLSMEPETEILILEMGMNHKGELSELVKYTNPDIAIITSVGLAHRGNFNSEEEIANAKLEILSGRKTPLLICRHGVGYFDKIAEKMTVSLENPEAEVFISIVSEGERGTDFDIMSEKSYITSNKISLVGKSYMWAIAFSVAIADILNFSENDIRSFIAKIQSINFRKRVIEIGNIKLIDDTYSSSPEAVREELRNLAISSDIHSAVLGDMLELGELTRSEHEKIGALAYLYGCARLYAFGTYAHDIANGAQKAGMRIENIHVNTDLSSPKATALAILKNAAPKECILFKGSHSTHTERIIEHLENLLNKKKE